MQKLKILHHTHTQMEYLDVNAIVYGAIFPIETKNISFSSHEQSDMSSITPEGSYIEN